VCRFSSLEGVTGVARELGCRTAYQSKMEVTAAGVPATAAESDDDEDEDEEVDAAEEKDGLAGGDVGDAGGDTMRNNKRRNYAPARGKRTAARRGGVGPGRRNFALERIGSKTVRGGFERKHVRYRRR
jgi:hypothetical protein